MKPKAKREKQQEQQASAEVETLDISAPRIINSIIHPDYMRDIEAAAAIAGQSVQEFATQAIIRHAYATIGLDGYARRMAKVKILPVYMGKKYGRP